MSLEESRNNETKSTAGDKYETGRAMMQIEIDNCAAQLLKAEAAQNKLNYIGLKTAATQVQEGSLVETNRGIYFVAIGLGKVKIQGQTHFCISKNAPIAKALLAKKIGESTTFNGNEILIQNIK